MSHLIAAFSRRTSLPSFLTRFFTGGARWSHCGIYDVERGEVIEALMFKGVVATPLMEWMGRYPSSDFTYIDCPNASAALEFAREQIGKPYDYLAAFGVPWRTDWDNPDRWYCSELLEAALAHAGRRRWRLEKRGVSPMESWMVL
jgi:uncharacterized protein YycO